LTEEHNYCAINRILFVTCHFLLSSLSFLLLFWQYQIKLTVVSNYIMVNGPSCYGLHLVHRTVGQTGYIGALTLTLTLIH